MRPGLTLATAAVEIKAEKKIDVEGEIDAAEGATNKAIRPILIDLYTFSFSFFKKPGQCLTLCRSLASLWLNLWDEKQRKMVKFDKGKN
jgi:hypothetical protein